MKAKKVVLLLLLSIGILGSYIGSRLWITSFRNPDDREVFRLYALEWARDRSARHLLQVRIASQEPTR